MSVPGGGGGGGLSVHFTGVKFNLSLPKSGVPDGKIHDRRSRRLAGPTDEQLRDEPLFFF